ncbi:unnamed protein product [Lymnaea stagnalis]|uniref:Uncharacterized protein n=1 Tax=Lymnaea stagnalis TaxID=6523 RepID=A0AAV2IBW7_LYMST
MGKLFQQSMDNLPGVLVMCSSVKFSFIALLMITMINPCICNQMDPHVYPNRGPFFEGWYLRIIDPGENLSLGFLFGLVLPIEQHSQQYQKHCHKLVNQLEIKRCLNEVLQMQKHAYDSNLKAHNSSFPLVYTSLLLSFNSTTKLDTPTGFFNPDDCSVTKDGRPVTKNPDDLTPPNFEAVISQNLSFAVTENKTMFSVTVGNHIFKGFTFAPVPWGPGGEGPESWLEKMPLPIHWFVYSLHSTVRYYEYVNLESGKIIRGGSKPGAPVIAHMEKNWGKSFPKAWVWAEGVDIAANVAFSFSSGVITELGMDIDAQLSGYRNGKKNISCSFNPVNSVHTLVQDGCSGTAVLTVKCLDCAVTFDLSAPPDTLSYCLATPQVVGFKKGCVESYVATARVTVHQRRGVSMVLTDSHTINQAALEFGEKYMCNGSCPPEVYVYW